MISLRALALVPALLLTTLAPTAWAQTPPPAAAPPPAEYAPPPAGYAPPPAGYAPLPAGYAPPPGGYYAPPMQAGPRILPYEEGEAIPPGYHAAERFRTGLVVGGSVTFGVMYLFSASIGGLSQEYALTVPLAGPFIEIGHLNSGEGAGVAAVILVVDGLAQIGGAAMLIGGLASKKKVLLRDDIAKSTWHPTPMVLGQGAMGFGIVGSM